MTQTLCEDKLFLIKKEPAPTGPLSQACFVFVCLFVCFSFFDAFRYRNLTIDLWAKLKLES